MTTDALGIMLSAQADVQAHVGYKFETMETPDRIAFIKDMVLACSDELHEALGETGWKPWATSRHINREEYMGEITDAWLFLMNLMLVVGMAADDLVEITAKKQDNVFTRMAAGYDGQSTKCPVCRRAYDNDGVKCTPDGGCGYEGDRMHCLMCKKVIVDDGSVMCRPANAYQGAYAYCATLDQHSTTLVTVDREKQCMACTVLLVGSGCVNPTPQGFGWCARLKCGHSEHHGLMHPTHGKGKASA